MTASLSRLWNLFLENSSQLTAGEMILRASLIGCSLFALVQLLSMLATHYGDRNCMAKSFFLSLLLHCCVALGWATAVDNQQARRSGPPGESEPVPVRVTLTPDENSEAGGTEQASLPQSTLPQSSWSSSTQSSGMEVTRIRRVGPDSSADEMPAVTEYRPEPTVAPETPDFPSNVEDSTPTPTQESVASTAVSAPARAATEIDQPQPQARTESVNASPVSRQQMARELSVIEPPTRIEPQRGAAQRVAPLIEDGAVLTLPTELAPEPAAPKLAGVPSDFIRGRSDPSAVATDVSEPGGSPTSVSSSASVENTGDRRNGKFSRVGTRSAPGGTTGSSTEPALPLPTRSTPAVNIPREQVIASKPSAGAEISLPAPRPELARPDSSPTTNRTPMRDPEPYRSRRLEQRKANALKNGGSEESERAVEASLRWLAGIQEADGSWSAARHGAGTAKKDPQGQNRLDGGLYADSGITGLVVLSYLGAGYTHEEGKYSDVVMRAVKWLINQQNPNGYLGGKATRYDMMYCHAMATFALAEAYGMQNDPEQFPELRDAVRNGVRLICAMQNEDGGWRYGKGGESDMSMFGWQLMALKSAVNAGLPVPEETKRGMTKFLKARSLGARGGLAGYKVNEPPTPAMTAEALFCRQMFAGRPRDGASQEAAAYLRQNLPRLSVYDEYYWYYGTLAMFQYAGAPWEEWNNALRDTLIGLQRTQGPLAGSWDPNGKWAGIGGRIYATALSTMSLEVYYRVPATVSDK